MKIVAKDVHIFLLLAGLISLLGVMFVYAASAWYAAERMASATYFFRYHLCAVLCAVGAGTVFYVLPTTLWREYAPQLFGLVLLGVLAGVVAPGMGNSLAAWVLPVGWSVAWGELIKLSSCLYLAAFLAKRQQKGWTFTRGLVPLCVIFGFAALVLIQHGLSVDALMLLITVVTVCFVAQRAPLHVLAVFSSIMAFGVWTLWQHPEWLSSSAGYTPALVCLGSGGWAGAASTYATQLLFCHPAQQSTLIFSLLAQEVGFIGSVLILLLYLLFFACGVRVVLQLHNAFCAYTVLSLLTFTALQVWYHLLVNVGLPLGIGCPLPFISFGASSLVVQGCLLGFALKSIEEQEVL